MGRQTAFIGGVIIPPYRATLAEGFFSALHRVAGLAQRVFIILLLGCSDRPAGFHQCFDMGSLFVFI